MSGRPDTAFDRGAGPAGALSNAAPNAAVFDAAQLYPPTDPGLPSVEVEVILSGQRRLMSRARRAVGGDDDAFTQRIRRPVEALAHEVHLLPATSHDHFAGPGGLIRQALECAVQCAQAARGRLFTPERAAHERHLLEPRWRQAAFLAGLTCELARTLDAVVVCDDSGDEWPKEERGLCDWLSQRGLARYHVSWLPVAIPRGMSTGSASIFRRIVSADVMAWLNEGGDPRIARDLATLALGASENSGSQLGELVASVREEVLRLDEARRPCRYGLLRVGHHLELHVLDAIRAKIEDGTWALEADKAESLGIRSPLRCRDGSAFLLWPEGAAAIVKELLARGLTGVPRASRTLLECLAGAGLLEARGGGDWLWPTLDGAGTELKFTDVRVLLPAEQVDDPIDDLCVDRWRRAWNVEPGCDVLPLGDGRVAVSQRLACASHPQPARLLDDLRKQGWLALPEGVESAPATWQIRFRDGRRPALVLTADAARRLRLGL